MKLFNNFFKFSVRNQLCHCTSFINDTNRNSSIFTKICFFNVSLPKFHNGSVINAKNYKKSVVPIK